jgi:hypothetical protein
MEKVVTLNTYGYAFQNILPEDFSHAFEPVAEHILPHSKIAFEVKAAWLENYLAEHDGAPDVDTFLSTYIWDESERILELAYKANAVTSVELTFKYV